MNDIVVVNGRRTPFGRFGGSFRDIPSFEVRGRIIRKVIESLRRGIQPLGRMVAYASICGAIPPFFDKALEAFRSDHLSEGPITPRHKRGITNGRNASLCGRSGGFTCPV